MSTTLTNVEAKAHVLAFGVKFSPVALDCFTREGVSTFLCKRRAYGNPDDASYATRSIPQEIVILPSGIVANAVWKEESPWTVDYINGQYFLIHGEFERILVSFTKRPKFYGMKLNNGKNVESVLTYMFGHTIGIFVNTNCYFATVHKPCKFCSISNNHVRPGDMCQSLDVELTIEAISTALKNSDVPIDNIFISGGNYNVHFDENFLRYVDFAKNIKTSVNAIAQEISVTLNVYPSQTISLAKNLHNSDLNVMVSTEVFDDFAFKTICPGKSLALSKEYLFEYLRECVSILGINHVFSFVIQGLEDENSLKKGIKQYAEIGVCTVVHILRIEPGTDIQICDVKIPSPEQIIRVAQYVKQIYLQYGFDSTLAYGGRSSLDLEASVNYL